MKKQKLIFCEVYGEYVVIKSYSSCRKLQGFVFMFSISSKITFSSESTAQGFKHRSFKMHQAEFQGLQEMFYL